MAFFRRSDPKPDTGIVIDTKSYKAWKDDPGSAGGARWLASLTNEMASSKPGYTSQESTPGQNRTMAAAGDRYVLEEAMGLELSRPRTGSRSVQADGHGRGRVPLFNISGIWRARQPDLSGRVDYGRWPETSIPRRGQASSHNYGPPVVHQVVDTRGSGRAAGRDGCPGCPQC